MKSHQRLYGIIFLAWLLSGCSTSGSKSKDGSFTSEQIEKDLKVEQSLSGDRQKLEELRKDIPEEKRVRNDEEAQWLQWMGKVEKNPTDVRNRYYEITRRQRDRRREKVQKVRDAFSRKERTDREQFTKKMKDDRDKFVKRNKKDQEKLKVYFSEEEVKRKTFYSDQMDKRKSFESEMNMQTQDFENYMREQQKTFTERIREYTERYNQALKEKNKGQPTSTKPATGNEFQDMDAVPGTRLAPPEEE